MAVAASSTGSRQSLTMENSFTPLKLGTVFWAGILCLAGILASLAMAGFGGDAAGRGPILEVLCVFLSLLLVALFLILRSTVREIDGLIEDREQTAMLLQGQIERHRQAIDGLAHGLKSALFVCDTKAGILYANQRAMEWYRIDQPVGRSLLSVTISYELEQLALDAVSSETPVERELTFTYPEDRTTLARAWSEREGDRVFVSLNDVTELRRLERVRQDFVANVSHEIRTPLAAIRSLAETLHDEPKASLEKRLEYLKRIIDEVDRLATVVSDLLVLSTAESNPVRKQACDMAAVIRSTLALLSPKAKEKQLEVVAELPPSLVIEANPAQMNQVVINLVDNALNYTQEGSIRVELTASRNEIQFRIQDTGIGIPSEDLPRIFERFYRVDKGRSRSTGGTGLGLSIVRHIVEAHGGKVEVESTFRVGTTFTVTLPIGNPSA